MAIYYHKNNKISIDRYDNLPPISGITLDNPQKISINSLTVESDFGLLQSSLDFGSDSYIRNNIKYKPIFKLYNKFYQ